MSKRSSSNQPLKASKVAKSSTNIPSYYLFKTEPLKEYSIQELEKEDDCTCYWDGVRNYQARNIMRGMKMGDKGFFYHSNAKKETGIVGIVEVVKEYYPDPTQSAEDKAKPEDKQWSVVDVKLVEKWEVPFLLTDLKEVVKNEGDSSPIHNMKLLAKGSRLSVQPVSKEEWDYINKIRP